MKRSVQYYLLVVLISCLPLIGIFSTTQLLHTHDGFAHLARIPAYFKALRDGEFPVRWAGDLNFGYGMPLFNFMYQVPYAIASVLLLIGFHLVPAYKITLALSYVLAGVGMYAFTNAYFEDEKKALWITIFYQFAPFRLIELLVRGAFGEVYTYAFLPLVLFGMVRLWKKPSYGNFLLTTTATVLLILSHNALSLVFFGVCVGFLLLFGFDKKKLLMSAGALGLGLLLSIFYWMPAIIEHKYTYGDLFMKSLYLEHFPPFQNFIIPNIFNDIHLQTKGISVQFGFFHVAAIVLSCIVLFQKKKTNTLMRKLIIVNLCVLALTVYFMQPISKVIWAHSTLLRQFQFPWRLLSIVAFSTSLLSVSYFSFKFSQRWQWMYIGILVLVIGTTAYYWKPPLGYDIINETYFWNFPQTSTYFGETDVIWSEGPAKAYPKQRVEFISGGGTIMNFTKKTNSQTFLVKTQKAGVLVDHIEYFPGWRVYINGIRTPIQFQDPSWRGQITFPVPPGKSTVRLFFGETPLRFSADMLSLLAVGVLVCMWLFRRYIFYETKRN